MNEINKADISPLTLGTVSLGLQYGVFPGQQQPDTAAAQQLLRQARANGITTFDTAREYGSAEQLLGGLISDVQAPGVQVVSKFKITGEATINPALAKEQALRSVTASLRCLNLNRLPYCLFHMVSGYDMDAVCKLLPELLQFLEQEGLIACGGVSADHLMELERFAALPSVKVLQVPVNIWDQRLAGHPVWDQLVAADKIVFARSIFLKGLLLRDPGTLTGDLKQGALYLEQLAVFAEKCDMSVAQLCFSYVRDLRGITSIVFGADNDRQLLENIRLLQGPAIPSGILAAIQTCFRSVPEQLLTPRTWKL